jgi:hypothetical protein
MRYKRESRRRRKVIRGIVRNGRSDRKMKRNHANRGDSERQGGSVGERKLIREIGRKSQMKIRNSRETEIKKEGGNGNTDNRSEGQGEGG